MAGKQEFRGLKGLKKQRRMQVIGLAFASLTAMVAIIYFFVPADAINLYRGPTEVMAETPDETETFRLGGLVKEGSISGLDGVQFSFVVTDGTSEIPVRYIGNEPRPDLFSEGTGTIVTGKLKDGVFEATVILAKHDETYMPKEVMDTRKEQGVYQDPTS